MKKYVKEAKGMYYNFCQALSQHKNINDAAKECGYELYVWDTYLGKNDDNVYVCINLNAAQIIGLTVVVNFVCGTVTPDDHIEIVDPETDDWDMETYYC